MVFEGPVRWHQQICSLAPFSNIPNKLQWRLLTPTDISSSCLYQTYRYNATRTIFAKLSQRCVVDIVPGTALKYTAQYWSKLYKKEEAESWYRNTFVHLDLSSRLVTVIWQVSLWIMRSQEFGQLDLSSKLMDILLGVFLIYVIFSLNLLIQAELHVKNRANRLRRKSWVWYFQMIGGTTLRSLIMINQIS